MGQKHEFYDLINKHFEMDESIVNRIHDTEKKIGNPAAKLLLLEMRMDS